MSNQPLTFDFFSEYAKQLINNQKQDTKPPDKPPVQNTGALPQTKDFMSEYTKQIISSTRNKPVTDAQRFRFIDQENMKDQDAKKHALKDFALGYTEQLINDTQNKPITDAQTFGLIDQKDIEPQETAGPKLSAPDAANLNAFMLAQNQDTAQTNAKTPEEALEEINEKLDRLRQFDGQSYANGVIMNFAPAIHMLENIKEGIQKAQKKINDIYMAQPADWTDSEIQARALKETDKWAYEAFVTSDPYISGNWDNWLALAQPGRTLTTEEREEAKMAAFALGQVAEKLYWSHGDPTYLSREEVQRYNTLTGLAGILESKASKAEAAILGVANVLPAEEISHMLHDGIPAFGDFQDSLYSDKNVADLMADTSLTGNAKAANPGWYKGANIIGNAVLTAFGGEALKLAGIASGAVADGIVQGAISGANSAVNQDWNKPGQALGNTLLDAFGSGALAYAGGKAFEKLDDVIKAYADDWHSSEPTKPTGSMKWPNSEEELFANGSGNGYSGGAGDVGFSSLDDYINNPKKFGEVTPEQLYKYLQVNGFNPSPLSGGNTKGITFEQGGGFKVNWGGDRILQYHPTGLNHHGGVEYFKVSSGPTGTLHFDLLGNPLSPIRTK